MEGTQAVLLVFFSVYDSQRIPNSNNTLSCPFLFRAHAVFTI